MKLYHALDALVLKKTTLKCIASHKKQLLISMMDRNSCQISENNIEFVKGTVKFHLYF